MDIGNGGLDQFIDLRLDALDQGAAVVDSIDKPHPHPHPRRMPATFGS
jgi:hypothetical protein